MRIHAMVEHVGPCFRYFTGALVRPQRNTPSKIRTKNNHYLTQGQTFLNSKFWAPHSYQLQPQPPPTMPRASNMSAFMPTIHQSTSQLIEYQTQQSTTQLIEYTKRIANTQQSTSNLVAARTKAIYMVKSQSAGRYCFVYGPAGWIWMGTHVNDQTNKMLHPLDRTD